MNLVISCNIADEKLKPFFGIVYFPNRAGIGNLIPNQFSDLND